VDLFALFHGFRTFAVEGSVSHRTDVERKRLRIRTVDRAKSQDRFSPNARVSDALLLAPRYSFRYAPRCGTQKENQWQTKIEITEKADPVASRAVNLVAVNRAAVNLVAANLVAANLVAANLVAANRVAANLAAANKAVAAANKAVVIANTKLGRVFTDSPKLFSN
jgi:uncharacterized protein YjbI with pentapeptide repeats